MPTLIPVRKGSSPVGAPLRLLVSGRESAPSPTNPCGRAFPPVADIIGWWDTSCALTVNADVGTGFLHTVADSSGNGNDMAKFGSSNFPIYSATAFNTSFPGVIFTATDLVALACPNFPMGTGNTLTAWYVGTMAKFGSGGFGRTLSYNPPGAGAGFEVM